MTAQNCMGARDTRCHPDPGMCACFDTPPDPNADLIGFEWQEGVETVRVSGPCSWSDQYVEVTYPTGYKTIKPVAVVRRRKELDASS